MEIAEIAEIANSQRASMVDIEAALRWLSSHRAMTHFSIASLPKYGAGRDAEKGTKHRKSLEEINKLEAALASRLAQKPSSAEFATQKPAGRGRVASGHAHANAISGMGPEQVTRTPQSTNSLSNERGGLAMEFETIYEAVFSKEATVAELEMASRSLAFHKAIARGERNRWSAKLHENRCTGAERAQASISETIAELDTRLEAIGKLETRIAFRLAQKPSSAELATQSARAMESQRAADALLETVLARFQRAG